MTAFIPAAATIVASLLSKYLEKKPKTQQFPTFGKGQEGLQDQIIQMLSGQMGQGSPFQQGQSYLSNLLSGFPEATKGFEAPFLRQFEEQTIPGLAERFSAMGAGGQRSSAFGQALSSAGAGLQENLASLRGQLQMQALPHAFTSLLPFLASAFAPRFHTGYQPGGPGPGAEFMAPFAKSIGERSGSAFADWAFNKPQTATAGVTP